MNEKVREASIDAAARLCGAKVGAMALGRKGDRHMTLGASIGDAEEANARFERGEILLDAGASFTA